MATEKSASKKKAAAAGKQDEAPASTGNSRLKQDVIGLCWLGLAVFTGLSLASYHNSDPSFNQHVASSSIHNLGGLVGAYVADALLQALGLLALLLPLGLLAIALRQFRRQPRPLHWYQPLTAVMGALSVCGLVALYQHQPLAWASWQIPEAGGACGRLLATGLSRYFNAAGSTVLLTLTTLISVMLTWQASLSRLLERWQQRRQRKAGEAQPPKAKPEKSPTNKAASKGKKARQEKAATEPEEPAPDQGPRIQAPVAQAETTAKDKAQKPQAAGKDKKKSAKGNKKQKEQAEDSSPELEFLSPQDTEYQMPELSLLEQEGTGGQLAIDHESLRHKAQILEGKLQNFGVQGQVEEIKPGPVVTMFEFAPAPGVKVNKIANLADDLSMALKATSIRIVAPIPGRGVVGIELPNNERQTVSLKEVLASQSKGRLPLALGSDIFGQPVSSDLAKMPHLLVAGATGSGKSVSINTMVLSLLYNAQPKDVRIILVDPKMLELSIYEGIPHLLLPVVTDPKKAVTALNWAVREMERRYKLMAEKGVRHIDGYNRKLRQEEAAQKPAADAANEETFDHNQPSPGSEELEHGHLPYIVVIVDELADLMLVAGREIEEAIARLAQMARAAGIHLILATQRPSVDVITGLIKANFPTRISFKVFSRTDSRTILDSSGAEALLGMGDMLFLPQGAGTPQRVHGAFVSEDEVQKVVAFLKAQGEPEYDTSILEATSAVDSDSPGDSDEGYDEKWDEALALVQETRTASISMLQRRLRVGYNRAARMIEQMEQEGVVGPSDGTSRGREVLLPPNH